MGGGGEGKSRELKCTHNSVSSVHNIPGLSLS